MVETKCKNSLVGGLFLGLALMLILTSPALAEETKWKALVPGNWNDSAKWTNDVPAKGYDAIIDILDANVTYHNSSNPTLNFLRLGLDPDPLNTETVPVLYKVTLTQEQDFLTVKNAEIGSKGTANYFHNGGTFKVLQDLTLGTATDGKGNYSVDTVEDEGGNMIWGTLSVGGHETLGLAGEGHLDITGPFITSVGLPSLECAPPVTPSPPAGPTHSVGKNLYLGVESGSEGGITLYNSSLTVGGSTKVGIKGTGLFLQTNSIVKIKGNYYPPPLPPYSPVVKGTPSYSPVFSALSKKNLKNNKLECVSNREPGLIVGLENVGDYNMTGGALNVNYSEIIGLGSLDSLVKDGMGYFLQTDGTHTINGNLYLGKEANGYGEFLLSLTNPQNPDTSVGLLDVHGFASVGYLGEGWFTQKGGTVKIWGIDHEVNMSGKSLSTTLSKGASLSCSQQQYIGFTVGRGGTGDYNLMDGELLVSHGEIIGMHSGSNGAFEQNGGQHIIGGNLTISRDLGSIGKYDFSSGLLTAWGGIVNNGNFNMTNPGITPEPPAKMVIGAFINGKNGVVSITNTKVTFSKDFQNNGKYESTSSTSKFKNLTIKADGYIKAGVYADYIGDFFTVSGNFINEATQKGDWNTQGAEIKFTGAGTHYFKSGGKNFAWGAFSLADKAVVVRLQGDLHAGNIDGVNAVNDKITNMYGFCGIQVSYTGLNPDLEGKWLYTAPGGKMVGKFVGGHLDTTLGCK